MDSESNCSMCLEKLSDTAKLQCCNHEFHYICISEWSDRSLNCPICRQTSTNIIYGDEIKPIQRFKWLKYYMIQVLYEKFLRFMIMVELHKLRDNALERRMDLIEDPEEIDEWIESNLLWQRLDQKIEKNSRYFDDELIQSFECHYECFERRKRKFIKNYITSLFNRYFEQNIYAEWGYLREKIESHLENINANVKNLFSDIEEENPNFLFDD